MYRVYNVVSADLDVGEGGWGKTSGAKMKVVGFLNIDSDKRDGVLESLSPVTN